MANNDDRLVPDPDDEEELERGRRNLMLRNAAIASRPRYAPAELTAPAPPEAPDLVPAPPEERVTPTAAAPRPPSYQEMLQSQYEQLYRKRFPEQQPGYEKPTGWRRVGKTLETIGEDVATGIAPRVMAAIPGTKMYRDIELQKLGEALGLEQERQGTAEYRRAQLPKISAETERDLAEAAKARAETTGPKRLSGGLETAVKPETGETLMGYGYPGGGEVYVPPGTIPPATITPAAAPAPGVAGAIPSISAAAPTAPARPPALPPGFVIGKPKEMTAEQDLEQKFYAAAALPPEKRSEAQQKLYAENVGKWGKNVPMTAAEIQAGTHRMNDAYRRSLDLLGEGAPKPPALTPNESAEAAEKKMNEYETKLLNEMDRKQRELDAAPTKLLAQELLAQKLQDKKDAAKNEADMAYQNLYLQDEYKRAMEKWYKSGHFAKDVGLVKEQVSEIHRSGFGASPALTGTIGALFGPAGAAVGAGLGVLSGAISGPAGGYLDALKRAGISTEGYDAMQTYVNALPARMAWEIGVQGLKASNMRLGQMMAIIIKTVPDPATTPSEFDRAFGRYYDTMKASTDRKYSGREGYVPPPNPQAPTTPAAPATPPAGKHWNPVTRRYE